MLQVPPVTRSLPVQAAEAATRGWLEPETLTVAMR